MGEHRDLKDRHRQLLEKAVSPQSVDIGRGAIFIFDKYCRHCGAGLTEPEPYEKKGYLKLYRKSYCSERCGVQGPTRHATQRIKNSRSFRKKIHLVEYAAFIALKIKRANLDNTERLAMFADHRFRLLSEKLAWMEVQTGKNFYPKAFYRILKQVQKRIS